MRRKRQIYPKVFSLRVHNIRKKLYLLISHNEKLPSKNVKPLTLLGNASATLFGINPPRVGAELCRQGRAVTSGWSGLRRNEGEP